MRKIRREHLGFAYLILCGLYLGSLLRQLFGVNVHYVLLILMSLSMFAFLIEAIIKWHKRRKKPNVIININSPMDESAVAKFIEAMKSLQKGFDKL